MHVTWMRPSIALNVHNTKNEIIFMMMTLVSIIVYVVIYSSRNVDVAGVSALASLRGYMIVLVFNSIMTHIFSVSIEI